MYKRPPTKTSGRYYIWRLICGKSRKQKQGINSETHRLPDKGQCVGEHCFPNPHINKCVLASICSDSLTHAHMMSKICTLSLHTHGLLAAFGMRMGTRFSSQARKTKCNISLYGRNVKRGLVFKVSDQVTVEKDHEGFKSDKVKQTKQPPTSYISTSCYGDLTAQCTCKNIRAIILHKSVRK